MLQTTLSAADLMQFILSVLVGTDLLSTPADTSSAFSLVQSHIDLAGFIVFFLEFHLIFCSICWSQVYMLHKTVDNRRNSGRR